QTEAVTYSGPTFIRIRSSKHDSSTAYSHGKDFDNLIVEEKLHNFTITDGQSKPIIVIISNSGPNKNLCYRKIVQMITSDKELEKYNFKAAGNVLTSVWENTIINNYPVIVKKYKKTNLSKEPVLDIDFKSGKTIQVDKKVVLEDLLETYPRQVQVQEELIADRVLIVN
ncbi:5480_t:CDS:2, partial [Dentiscutata heterogama]